jgi:putative transposase
MARKPRVLEPNRVYHVYNRRTDRQRLFPSPRSLDEFFLLMEEGRTRYNVRICGYCLMETHWHQAIWIREGNGRGAAIGYLRRLSSRHALQFRLASRTRGEGHVYQDRYKAKPVADELGYLTLLRYIEANPVAAGLVERAEEWQWSSLTERISGRKRIVDEGPVPLPSDWLEIVNATSRRDEKKGTEVARGTEVAAGTGVAAGTEVGGGTEVRLGTEAYNPLL